MSVGANEMKLREALNLKRGEVVAFTGAGGKTSVMLTLGRELVEVGWRVLMTSTMFLSEDELQRFPQSMYIGSRSDLISSALSRQQMVFMHDRIESRRVSGITPEQLSSLPDRVDSDVLLVEADTSEGLPFKAPHGDEPLIPGETSLVVPVVSLKALDRPLTPEYIYNPRLMVEKYGFYEGSQVRSPWIAQVLRDDEMGLKGVPPSARIVGFLNHTPEHGYLRSRARLIARLALKNPRLSGVILGSTDVSDPVCEVQRPIGAIVLAAGRSSRMGQPKLLLPWENGQSIVEHICSQLIRSRIEEIVVVTGFYAAEVKQSLKPLGIRTTHNRAHKTGDMLSSIKAGLRAMPDHVSAALVVLGDQPRLQPRVLYEVRKAYSEQQNEIIAPSYQGRRGHPILIGRRYWPEILSLGRDESLRDVLNKYAQEIAYVQVYTDSVLHDVDTPADYHAERQRAGLRRQEIDRDL